MKIKTIHRVIGSEGSIKVLFEHNGQEAEFEYTLIGQERGINYCSYKEKDLGDIYVIIHDWVKENITTETKVLFNGKEVTYLD